jgi:hypothetical protein
MSVSVIEDVKEQNDRIRIIHSWRVNKKSPTLIFAIPQDLRKQYDLDEPGSMYLIPKKEGILLKKVQLEGIVS